MTALDQGESQTALKVDIAIIGAGPTGIYAAYCSGFRGMSSALIDALPEAGGQVAAMYPEKPIYDVAGFPAVKGRDFVAGLLEQANRYDVSYVLGSPAQRLERLADGGFLVETGSGAVIQARSVVLSAGIGSFTPRPLPAGREHEGRGLVYFVPMLADMTDRDIIIVGGGDSAFDWALSLEDIARSVTLVHRRAAFKAHAGTVKAVLSSSVRVMTDFQVTGVHGDDWVDSVTLTQVITREAVELECQGVVAALGFTANLGPLQGWGVEVVDRHIPVDTRMSTNVPGVFAAGDITEYAGKVRIMSVGFGEAATAVNNAATVLDPDATVFPGHSTEV